MDFDIRFYVRDNATEDSTLEQKDKKHPPKEKTEAMAIIGGGLSQRIMVGQKDPHHVVFHPSSVRLHVLGLGRKLTAYGTSRREEVRPAQLAGRGDIGCMTAAALIKKVAQLVILGKDTQIDALHLKNADPQKMVVRQRTVGPCVLGSDYSLECGPHRSQTQLRDTTVCADSARNSAQLDKTRCPVINDMS